MPAAPATRASVKLSMSSCAATRARPAPSATRTAISLVRPSERDKRRLPTFAQATRSTTTTAENMSTSGRRVLPTIASLSETGKYSEPWFWVGCSRSNDFARRGHVHRRVIERHAWLEPGDGENPPGFPARRCGIRHMHRHDDAGSLRGRWKAKPRRGYADDLPQLAPDRGHCDRSRWHSIRSSSPRAHIRGLRLARAPWRVSSAVNCRPSAGVTRSNSKSPEVAESADTLSGSPSP